MMEESEYGATSTSSSFSPPAEGDAEIFPSGVYIYVDPTDPRGVRTQIPSEELLEYIDFEEEQLEGNELISGEVLSEKFIRETLLPKIGKIGKKYDYCMVLPADENGTALTNQGSKIVEKMKELGLDLKIRRIIAPHSRPNSEPGTPNTSDSEGKGDESISDQGHQVFLFFVYIHCPLPNFRAYAIDKNYMMLCDSKELMRHAIRRGIMINDSDRYSSFDPYESIYVRYTDSLPESLYWRPDGMTHPFRSFVRLVLLNRMVEEGLQEIYANEDHDKDTSDIRSARIKGQIFAGNVLGFYPLHKHEVSRKLLRHWNYLYNGPWNIPLFQIKEYFGEKIALFVALGAHFTTWLMAPAAVGIPLTIIIVLNDWDFSSIFLPAFAFSICIWAIIMLEYWKRTESAISLSWGTVDFEVIEEVRPEFKGEKIRSYVDGTDLVYFPPEQKSRLVFFTCLAVAGVIILLLGIVAAIYVLRYNMNGHPDLEKHKISSQTMASALNSIIILIANPLYFEFATFLCSCENHRTDFELYDSMVTKLFVFQFINSYASFIYLAFIAAYIQPAANTPDHFLGDCGYSNCMKPLAINLVFLFSIRLFVGNVTTIALPIFMYYYRLWTGKIDARSINTDEDPETEFLLEVYDTDSAILSDTCDLVIQFGFVTMFISAMPAVATFALLCNIMKMKADAWSLVTLYQRPRPVCASSIGTWQEIFTIISILAIISNGGMTVLTMNVVNDYNSSEGGFWFFTLFQWMGFLLQYIFWAYIDDIPPDVAVQLKRTEFLRNQIFDKKVNTHISDVVNRLRKLKESQEIQSPHQADVSKK